MKKPIEIILVQHTLNGVIQFRIAKLVGAVSVETLIGGRRTLHVGDEINEKVADDLSSYGRYVVTVTQKNK